MPRIDLISILCILRFAYSVNEINIRLPKVTLEKVSSILIGYYGEADTKSTVGVK